MEKHQVLYERGHLAIDLLSEERVLNVQRQHWIALGTLFLTHSLLVVLVFVLFTLVSVLKIFPLLPNFFFYLTLLFLSILATIGTYSCMRWYFTFYIITDKRLIICQYFRVIGAHYQEMLLHHRVELETKRVTTNIIYDLLDIENILVTLHEEDMPEPITFITPQHPQQIEAALAELETQRQED